MSNRNRRSTSETLPVPTFRTPDGREWAHLPPMDHPFWRMTAAEQAAYLAAADGAAVSS